MTQNQIAWNNFKEVVRHNREMERLTGEELTEKIRSNKASESIKEVQNAETHRSNVAQEGLSGTGLVINETHYARMDAETKRHNQTEEYGKYFDPLIRSQKAADTGEKLAYIGLIDAQTTTEQHRPANIDKDTELKGAQVVETYSSAEQKSASAKKTNEEAAREYINRQYQDRMNAAKLEQTLAENEKIKAETKLKQSQRTETQTKTSNNVLNLVPKALNILDDITKRIYNPTIF